MFRPKLHAGAREALWVGVLILSFAGVAPAAQKGPGSPGDHQQEAAHLFAEAAQDVNSGRYVAWLMDSYSFEFHQTYQVRSFEINYTGETKGAETVSIRSHEDSDGLWSHSIVSATELEVCRARVFWVPREP